MLLTKILRRHLSYFSKNSGSGVVVVPTRKRMFMRRIYLPRMRYYIYYLNSAPGIEILALWHASRRPPRGL